MGQKHIVVDNRKTEDMDVNFEDMVQRLKKAYLAMKEQRDLYAKRCENYEMKFKDLQQNLQNVIEQVKNK